MRVSLRDSIGKSTILKSLTKNIKPDTKSLDKRENVVERREEMPNFHLKSQMVRPSQSASNIFKSGSVHKSNSNPKPANPLLKRDKKFNYNRVANATSGTNPDVPSKTKTKLERFPVKSKPEAKPKVSKEFQVQNGITVSNLASRLQITVFTLQKKIMKEFGMNLSGTDYINQELLVMLLLEFGKNPIVAQDFDLQKRPEPIDWSTFPKRDPIVTIMGHVDHGKTTLLDSLRGTSVVSGEHGGITQHIGAFSVLLPSGKRITFLDTPGHAAFSAMRKRGAQVTDICVLVVAADDGLMPQTIEAINHCLEASVPIIVALNKCDKPNIDKKRVLEQLAQHNVLCEEMGGEVPCVAISGKTKMGLDELEDTIIATAEINDYRGDYDGAAEGTIIESKMTQKLGVVATVLISRGTLRLGSYILAGNSWCKVKRIVDDTGKSRSTAGPSIPVEVQGWKGLPEAGDQVLETQDEVIIFYQATTKKVIKDRERRAELAQSFKEIELLNEKASVRREEEENTSMNGGKKISSTESGPKKFNIIIKADVDGSLKAIEAHLGSLPNHKVQCNIVAGSVGQVSDSDIEFAKATGAEIYTFNTTVTRANQALASRHKVNIQQHNVIYHLMDQLKESMAALLEPERLVQVSGEAEILKIFEITNSKKKIEYIAGSKVFAGKVMRNQPCRVQRNSETIYEGNIKTFKHHKKDILEAAKGLECGIAIENFEGLQVGDIIQSLTITSKRQTI